MGGVLALPTLTPGTNRPAAWDALNARYDEAAVIFDRDLIATPAHVAKESARCGYVALFCAGGGCGFARSCGTCPSNSAGEAAHDAAETHRRHTLWLTGGKASNHAPLSDEGGR